MELNQYQNKAAETAIYPGRFTIAGLAYTSLGLGEAGEVQNKVKKLLRDDTLSMDSDLTNIPEEKRQAIAKELGGNLWYIAETAGQLGYSLEEIAKMNLGELGSRKERGTLHGSGDDR